MKNFSKLLYAEEIFINTIKKSNTNMAAVIIINYMAFILAKLTF